MKYRILVHPSTGWYRAQYKDEGVGSWYDCYQHALYKQEEIAHKAIEEHKEKLISVSEPWVITWRNY